MPDHITVETIRTKFAALRPFLDERTRRVWAASEAVALGRGGVSAVAQATGLRRNTVRAGLRDLAASPPRRRPHPRPRRLCDGCGHRAVGASRWPSATRPWSATWRR